MAEIDIKNIARPIWNWIIGVVSVLAIVAGLISNNTKDDYLTYQSREQANTTAASKHLRYIPQVLVTQLETYMA